MTRDELLQVGLNAAKEEYGRAQARLALIETKAALVAATVGILLTLVAAIGPERVPHSDAGHRLLAFMAIGSLVVSLILSIAASLLVDVRSPQSAEEVCKACEERLVKLGDRAIGVNESDAEILVGNMAGTFLVASREISGLLADRSARLRAAQIALLAGILFIGALVAPAYL